MYRAAYVLLARLCTEPLCIGPRYMGSNVCEAAASPVCWSHYVQRSPMYGAPLMHSAPYVQRSPMYGAPLMHSAPYA